MTKILAAFFATLILVPVTANAAPPRVVATFSILADIAQHVGGDDIGVVALIGPDADAHAYKPTPKDAKTLAQADIFIVNGLGFDGWGTKLAASSGFKGQTVVASANITPRTMTEDGRKMTDPHAWQDVANARAYARNIAAALKTANPEAATRIEARANAYDTELRDLDAWTKTQIATINPAQRKIVTSHDAFGYFGAAYGVTLLSAQGVNAESSPKAHQIANLVTQLKAEKVKRVFFENMASPRLAQQLAKEANADIGPPVYSDALSPPGGPAPTYIDMFRNNVNNFVKAMQLNDEKTIRP